MGPGMHAVACIRAGRQAGVQASTHLSRGKCSRKGCTSSPYLPHCSSAPRLKYSASGMAGGSGSSGPSRAMERHRSATCGGTCRPAHPCVRTSRASALPLLPHSRLTTLETTPRWWPGCCPPSQQAAGSPKGLTPAPPPPPPPPGPTPLPHLHGPALGCPAIRKRPWQVHPEVAQLQATTAMATATAMAGPGLVTAAFISTPAWLADPQASNNHPSCRYVCMRVCPE